MKLLILAAMTSLLLETSAFAKFSPDLYRYFDQKIRQVKMSVQSAPKDGSGTPPPLLLEDIDIDLAATVSFGVNDVLTFAISPEIDFVIAPVDPPN